MSDYDYYDPAVEDRDPFCDEVDLRVATRRRKKKPLPKNIPPGFICSRDANTGDPVVIRIDTISLVWLREDGNVYIKTNSDVRCIETTLNTVLLIIGAATQPETEGE